jgi:hypothetical protein
MSKQLSARRRPFPIQETSLGSLEQADMEEAGEPICTARTSPEPTIEQIRAVRGTLSFLTALITFYGELIERDAHAGTNTAGCKDANLQ